MRKTLWSGTDKVNKTVMDYTAGKDRELDERLIEWDIAGTMAHALGLVLSGILEKDQGLRIHQALRHALELTRKGRFPLTEDDEDVHSALEKFLWKRLGTLGKSIHAGRSRNDQVLTDLKLFMKDRLLEAGIGILDVAEALILLGKKGKRILWPGYTHLRRAMPSTVGAWAAGFAEVLVDDLVFLEACLELLEKSPLGTGAGFGVPHPVPRKRIARALGFKEIHLNVTAPQLKRGKLEAQVLAALCGPADTIAGFCWDVIIFSTEEFGFLKIPTELSTGSSIMPQKVNPDIFELTRANAAVLQGLAFQAWTACGKLPSGYQRDLQAGKAPLIEGLETFVSMTEIMAKAVPRLRVNESRCLECLDRGTLAVDRVMEEVRMGKPFREAYMEVKEELGSAPSSWKVSPREVLLRRKGVGEVGNPGLDSLLRRVENKRKRFHKAKEEFYSCIRKLETKKGFLSLLKAR